jgi:hypothetical protein
MYKQLRLSKKTTISIEKFPETAKKVSNVYCNGIHKWGDKTSQICFYSLVFLTFRITYIIENKIGHCNS